MTLRESSLCLPDASGVSVLSCVETRLNFSGVQFRYLYGVLVALPYSLPGWKGRDGAWSSSFFVRYMI